MVEVLDTANDRIRLASLVHLITVARHDLNYPLNLRIFRLMEKLNAENIEETKVQVFGYLKDGFDKFQKLVDFAVAQYPNPQTDGNFNDAIRKSIENTESQSKLELGSLPKFTANWPDIELAFQQLLQIGKGDISIITHCENSKIVIQFDYQPKPDNLSQILFHFSHRPPSEFLDQPADVNLVMIWFVMKKNNGILQVQEFEKSLQIRCEFDID